jgi:hypothetical protein
VYDNLTDCPQGIYVDFYSRTACSPDTVYPEQDGELALFVFNTDGRLVSYHKDQNGIQHTKNKLIEVENRLFTVVAWAGLTPGLFDLNPPKAGLTTRKDLLFRLKRLSQQALSIEGQKVYYGESPIVFLPDPANYGSIFQHTSINLQEITNRMTVSVEGLPQAENYEIVVESANGSMNIDGSIAEDDPIRYASPASSVTGGVLETKFTLLKLETGHRNTLIIRDKRDGHELYRGDLLGTLLLKNPEVNLACDHDFTIRFTAADQCRCGDYMIVEIWVNNWLVHSYNTIL